MLACQAYGQSSAACSTFIRQKDSIICPGVSVTLNLLAPPSAATVLPGVWKLLIPGSSIDSVLFNIRPFGYDKARQYLYSIIHQKIIRFDLKNNSVSAVTAINWPGDFTEFTYDSINNRLLCWRSGRDSVFVLPAGGGSWTTAGIGSIDRECFGASPYWNPVTKQPGIYGGYGFNKMKSWIFENGAGGWQQKKSDPPIDSMPPKGGNLVAANNNGTKLYLFSGQGSYSGDELAGSCTLGSPWATASGMFCWLRDLWELDVSNYTFKNILPVNDQSIQYEGAVGYDYDKSRFYLFGGYQPTNDYVKNQSLPNTQKTFRFRSGIDTGFSVFTGDGDAPPAAARSGANGSAYYDPAGKRMIWARADGIWAYYSDTTLFPPSLKSVLWSTGDTASSITVKPTKTTVYKVTRIDGGQSCSDSIRITVPNMQTSLQATVNVCGDSVTLDAGANFSAYAWNTGEATQTIRAKQSGVYSVTVTSGLCIAKDSSKVLLGKPILDFIVRNQKDSVCAGDTDSLFVAAPQSGIVYSWFVPGNATVINTGPFYIAKNIVKDADYVISATNNPPVCTAKAAGTHVTLRTQFLKPVIHTDSVGLSTVIFRWDPVPGANGYLISMDNGNTYGAPVSGIQGLTQTVTGLLPNQPVSIVVKATGLYSCQTSDTSRRSATTLNPFGDGIYVPNAFTPNGDGVNDVFLAYGTAISTIRLMIYNQWGKQVFVSSDSNKGWDGTYQSGKAPAGLYTYALEAIMQDGKRVTKSGSFSLVR
jgi:gliding motility-associated-like protein